MTEKLTLGVEMTLSKQARNRQVGAVEHAGRAKYVPSHRRLASTAVASPRPFEYVFAEQQAPVNLVDDALAQLYLVLGAPGAGKSYFLTGLLKQLAASAGGWKAPWGGLVLDPKQTLIKDIQKTVPKDRKLVIGRTTASINLLKSHLAPADLGTALALAAQSAGVSASDPYWMNEMKRLFGDGLLLLQLLTKPLTLKRLAELFLGSIKVMSKGGQRVSKLLVGIERLEDLNLDDADDRRREAVVTSLREYANAKSDNANTLRSFVRQILSPFLDPDLDYLSDEESGETIGDWIIRDGKWVMLDVPKSKLAVSRFLSTLTKVLFASSALNRYDLYPENDRRIFLFADEYAEIASDLPGEGFGDSYFFSQARQFRVLSFIATQGIPMLENSGVRETWKTILTNSAGKLMFRVGDPDTAELAARMMGESDVVTVGRGVSHGRDGASVSADRKLERMTQLTSDLFITGLRRGDLVFMGVTDGKGIATIRYIKVK